MSKGFLCIVLVMLLFSVLVKESFSEPSTNDVVLQKIDSKLLNAQGETSVIISFTKKPQNYKQFIKSIGGEITKDYSLIDDIAVKLDGKDIRKLANLENLVKVYKDEKVEAYLHDSAHIISADNVWNQGITGKGVKVCVIDSGVDYTHPALGSCTPQIINGNNESYNLESPHDYPNNYNNNWTITKPGYTSISVHFVNISTESDYDKLYVKDAQGNIIETYTGEVRDRWSRSVPGNTIIINLVSDYSITRYGFYIDQTLNGTVNNTWANCDKFIGGYDFVNNDEDPFDDDGHGTHVTGIISSDDPYYRGIANGTQLLIAKVLDSSGSGYSSDVIKGIEWCVNNSASVISMSLGMGAFSGTCDDVPTSQAVNSAVANGTLVVVAAGNSGLSGIGAPACASKAIAVGATDKNKNVIGWSSKGSELDIVAPGLYIYSTYPGGWELMSGTSMAAPQISGVIALMLGKNPKLSFSDVIDIFNKTSDSPVRCYEGTQEIACTRNVTGAGIVNVYRAIDFLRNYNDAIPPSFSNIKPQSHEEYSPGQSYRFNVTWADNIGISTVIIENNFNGTTTNYTVTTHSGDEYYYNYNLQPGNYSWREYANDSANNWAITPLETFNLTYTTPPIISVVTPQNNSVYTLYSRYYGVDTLPLNYTVNENTSWMGYSLDGKPNATITGNTSLSVYTTGYHTLVLYANDTVGNMGSSSVSFYVKVVNLCKGKLCPT